MKTPTFQSHVKTFPENTKIELNIKGLIQLVKDNKIKVKFCEFPSQFSNALGAAHPNCILFNYPYLKGFHPINQYHVILHEIGHYLRIHRIGADNVNRKIAEYTLLPEFLEHLLEEERFAEKYASMTYYRLNGFLDNSEVRFNFNNPRLLANITSYAKQLHTDLSESGLLFFDYSKKLLNIK